MKALISRVALSVSALSVAFAPIAAQAQTRAGDSGAFYVSPAALQVSLLPIDEEPAGGWFDANAARVLLAVLGGAAVLAVLFTVDDGDDQSPGT